MLRWPRSLAFRAVATLLTVLVGAIVIGLGPGVLEGRKTRQGGADVALELALEELKSEGDRWVLPHDGAFGSLAARNPDLWLIGGDPTSPLVVGSAPPEAQRAFGIGDQASAGPVGSAGLGALLPDAAIKRAEIGRRSILIAVGGVEPGTIRSLDVLQTFSVGPALGLAFGLGLLGAIALLAANPLIARAVRPIVDDAASIGPLDGGRRLDEARAPPELLPLARAFNGALDRLEIELGRRRRLISNVAHELRTPLAVLSLRVDTLTDIASERESLRAEVARLSHLVEQMLDLERLSLPAEPLILLDLTQVAKDVIASLAPMAMNAGYDLSFDGPDHAAPVRGARQAMERAITNLVRNAIVHGGGRGLITVSVGEAWLEVADQGPGVPEALEASIFEAFVRGAGPVEGTGLGLHLTREIMQSLGGDVGWRREDGRTVFRLDFPTSDVAGQTGA